MQGNVWIEDIFQENFIDNPEALFRKTRTKHKKRSSTLQQEASSNQEDHRNLSSEFEAMANKSIREFSAPTTDNIRTGPAAESMELWAQAWTYQHGAIQPALWEGTQRC